VKISGLHDEAGNLTSARQTDLLEKRGLKSVRRALFEPVRQTSSINVCNIKHV